MLSLYFDIALALKTKIVGKLSHVGTEELEGWTALHEDGNDHSPIGGMAEGFRQK